MESHTFIIKSIDHKNINDTFLLVMSLRISAISSRKSPANPIPVTGRIQLPDDSRPPMKPCRLVAGKIPNIRLMPILWKKMKCYRSNYDSLHVGTLLMFMKI